jgi:ABC-type multidrug transport system ATPase subunit
LHRTLIAFLYFLSIADDKPVLKNLNGEFKSRELSVIVGPSGSGKSTLLNLLSGYNLKNVSGVIKVNGSPRDHKLFRHHSSYVMQDSLLHPLLSVAEAMSFSANLKIGKEMSEETKEKQVSSRPLHSTRASQLRISISLPAD